tara:strand:- start:821 stop:1468 length:648 start_codon:yes stop_codon:yes gene_type:complete
MPLDPKVEAAKRKAMAAVFEKTQRGMAAAVDELGAVRRLPVPFVSSEPVPEVSLPYPQDSHLVRSGEICFINPPGIFIPPEVSHTHASHDKPWATFEKTDRSIFSNTGPVAPKPADEGPTALDEEMYRTRHNEWTLQKNAYNPDIASQMRTNVRKAASLTSAVKKPDAFSQQKALIASSVNVQQALTMSDVTGPAPPVPKAYIKFADVYPHERVR